MSRRRVYPLAVAVWLLLFLVAFSLGAVRELLVAPANGEHLAHVVGTPAFVVVLLGIAVVFVRHSDRRWRSCGPGRGSVAATSRLSKSKAQRRGKITCE